MRIVFMGSAETACPALDRLLASNADTVVGVITQPDRAGGRSRRITPCPVRAFLDNTTIPILTPDDVNADESLRAIRDLSPDLIAVVAYGQILKPNLLQIPASGCINVHASLLPRYRGAAPVEWAIARGETMTGVTTMFINAEMDAGDIIEQAKEPVLAEDTAGSLLRRLAPLGADLLIHTLDMVRNGTARGTPQAHQQATYAPKLRKIDGKLDWARPAEELHNRVRGFNPRPGCFFARASGATVRVFKTRIEPYDCDAARRAKAGCVLAADDDGPLVLTGRGTIRLIEVQPEGRKVMSGASYLHGYQVKTGEQF